MISHSGGVTRQRLLTLPQYLFLCAVAYMWFDSGISTVWTKIPASSLSTFSLKPSPSPSDSAVSTSHYALLAAFTHSLSLCLGQFVCDGANKLSRRGRKGAGVAVAFMGICIGVVWYGLQFFFQQAFESKEGVVYEQASIFFYDQKNSSRFFALFSSCSYIFWLLAGIMVRSSSKDHVGIYPKFIQKHLLTLIFMLGGSFTIFHFLVFPLWFTLVGPMIKGAKAELNEENFTHEFSALATISHTAALVIGLLFARNSPSSHNLKQQWREFRQAGGKSNVLFSLLVFGSLLKIEGAWEVLVWMCEAVWKCIWDEASNFAYAMNCLISGTNLFSVSVMAVFYVGLLTLGYCLYAVARKIEVPVKVQAGQTVNEYDDDRRESPLAVTPKLVKMSRANKYRNVVKKNNVMETILWLSILSFFGSPHGIFCLYGIVHICSNFSNVEEIKSQPAWVTFATSSLITATGSIITFIPFARLWDKFYSDHPELRCQQDKEYKPQGLWRLEVGLAVMNLFIAAMLSSGVAIIHVHTGLDKVYFENPLENMSGFAYLLASTVLFFVWIDLWAYFAHRVLHFPWFYKNIHKLHHKWKQTTAFTSLALHPIEGVMLTGGVYVGLYLIPLHPAAILVNLLYIHYHNIVDHSGVYCESSLPWQPSSLYHDDHHKLFHLNFGQSLTIWDELGGTLYEEGKKYGVKRFSW